jgi:hypothetical protein
MQAPVEPLRIHYLFMELSIDATDKKDYSSILRYIICNIRIYVFKPGF